MVDVESLIEMCKNILCGVCVAFAAQGQSALIHMHCIMSSVEEGY